MAKYFSLFPKGFYGNRVVTDLLTRVKIKDTWLADPKLYYNYVYKDTDKPEHIAQKYYGDENLHWIILFTNNIFNAFYDFPMSPEVFSQYLNDKYKKEGEHINLSGIEYSQLTPDPIFRYQKSVKIINNEGIQEKNYVIDKKSYFDMPAIERYSTEKNYTLRVSLEEGSDIVTTTTSTNIVDVGDFINETSGTPAFIRVIEIIDIYHFRISTTSSITARNVKMDFYSYSDYGTLYEVTRRYPQVTIYERENEINEDKRLIKILKKDYVQQAKVELLSLLQ
jgi:Base plate wedge protein 53